MKNKSSFENGLALFTGGTAETGSIVLATPANRRAFFGKALGVGVAALAVTSFLPNLRADDDDDDERGNRRKPCPPTTPGSPSDIEILNYALTLEHLEAAFYVQGLDQFSGRAFKKGVFSRRLGSRLAEKLRDSLKLIRDHEVEHVAALTSTIIALGGTPVGPCTYDFGYSGVEEFLEVAQILENTGVSAYDGAIALISDPVLQTTGATIATVEARHAAYLNLVNGDEAFPRSFDVPKTMAEVLAAAGSFIVSCP